MERGLFQFTYGSKDSLVEFLHRDNFVQAHVRAAEAMQNHDSVVSVIIANAVCIVTYCSDAVLV